MSNIEFKNLNIKTIIPLAIQTGDLGGNKVVAKVIDLSGKEYFTFLLPPTYLPFGQVPEHLVDSAIIKHDYLPLKDKVTITSHEGLTEFLQSLE